AASDLFDWLPPLGIVPVADERSPSGFDAETFFGNQGSRDVALTDAGLLRELAHDALLHEPVAVGGGDRIQLYRIWENDREVDAGRIAQRIVVFSRAGIRYRGVARFGHARWNLSREAPSVI